MEDCTIFLRGCVRLELGPLIRLGVVDFRDGRSVAFNHAGVLDCSPSIQYCWWKEPNPQEGVCPAT